MWNRVVGASAVAFVAMLRSGSALAACSNDKECPGDQICESGNCAPPAAQLAVPPSSAPQGSPNVTASRPTPTALLADEPRSPERGRRSAPKGKRHSPGMMAAGIVITSLASVGLIVTSLGFLSCVSVDGSQGSGRQTCHSELMLGGLFFTATAVAVGVPLLLVGARREPVATAFVAPWLTSRSSGVRLVLEL